jgi:signal transduction histidine kinase
VLNVRRTETDATTLHMRPFALAPAIASAIGLVDPRDMSQHDLRVTVPADLLVYADEERLQQIMLNLLTNAGKYSAPGTPIVITASESATTRPRSGMHRAQPRPPLIKIAVRDYGLGVPPEQAALIFERFVRLDRDIASQTTGTGLGLALCRSYVEAMGGHIWAESSGVAGEGATFAFTLPAEPGDILISD